MPDGQGGRLTSDEWRRICAVLDRLHEARPELREAILEEACREQGVAIEDMRPFVDADGRSEMLPDEIPLELIANAFGDIAREETDFRLDAGQSLGPYEIVASLGAGGMGEVYRANDTRLDRAVAVKVLRPHLLQSAEARQRFDQEARAISRLNHPHVCTLYDVGHQEGIDFLVMEYVEGETLARRLERGALPVAQAIRFGSQIADALDRAHRQGIVHRDLKPANIILTRGGIKLLDFGLARLDLAGASDDRALIGTPQYMSPEQLERRQADARSDIFGCGAVLYEMVTGKRAFTGPSQTSVIAAILEHEPTPIARLVSDAPAALDWTIARCLAKDPDDRWQSAADLKHHLDWLAADAAMPAGSTRRTRSTIGIAAALIAGAVLMGLWSLSQRSPGPAPTAATVFAIEPPGGTTFSLTHSVSPDGRFIAFTTDRADGTRELWIRALESLTAQRTTGTEGAAYPFWSPDSRFVGFFADRKLKKVDLGSGGVHVICEAGNGGGGTWNQNGIILFSPEWGVRTGLWRVSSSGGTASRVTTPDEGLHIHAWPQFLPDGQRFIYMRTGQAAPSIYAGRLDSTDAHKAVMTPARTSPEAANGGRNSDRVFGTSKAVLVGDVLFFLDQGILMAQPFDSTGMTLLGDPVRVAENISTRGPGPAAFDAGTGGIVTYRQPASARTVQLAWVDRSGNAIADLSDPGPYTTVSISRDGRFVLANSWQERRRPASGSVTRIDVHSGASTPVVGGAASPVWSPDGSRAVYTKFGDGRGPTPTIAPLDGGPSRLIANFGAQAHATDWSRDDRLIVGSALHADTMWDIWIADAAGRDPLRYLTRAPFHQTEGHISPDGRWLAHSATDAGGAWNVYVRSFPDGGGLRRVSVRGGRSPRWRSDGRELYYVEPSGRLLRVPVLADSRFSPGAPELMFQHEGLAGEPEGGVAGLTYDVSPDGTRFLLGKPVSGTPPSPPIVVVLSWTFPAAR